MSYLSERKYWAISPSLSVIPNLCLFFICPVEQVPSLSLERLCSGMRFSQLLTRLWLSRAEQMVKMVRNSADWTHKAEASKWDSSLEGEHPEVILWPCNSKHQTLQGRESCCQACVLVSANPSEMPGSSEGPFYPCLQDCSTLWWYWKTHCPFLPLSFIFVLCLSVSILRWGHAPSDDCFPVLYLVLSVNSIYFFQCNIA